MKFKHILMAIGTLMATILFGIFFFSQASDSFASTSSEKDTNSSFSMEEGETHTITLITGDKLNVREMEDGKIAIDMEPAKEGDSPSFQKIEENDDVYIIPTNVASFVPNKIDRELFNVTQLIKQGYDDEHMDKLPLIVSNKNNHSMNAVSESFSASVTDQHSFTSIDAIAAKVKKSEMKQFSSALFTSKGNQLKASSLLNDQIDKIRLDRKLEVNLKESVPAIGGPEAWEAGYEGEGVNVAVLDTGVDTSHPDLKGKVVKEKNFSDDDTIRDLVGHGTHVSSIIAGSGEASDGEEKGVAPGAGIINGKVMNESGKGPTSDILKGMEWAAEQDADIINMSLGSGPTDGTDPLSQAVENLTEEYGVLFVISAGNTGPEDQTVGSPGVTDAALTVGAVNNSNELASFSSRGPRVGDYAIKPDITAPGVDVMAARADGTSMGTPVNEYYTRAPGTSMAAPHVAGAAALLVDKLKGGDKEWTPKSLKDHLISTATPNDENTVYEQGGGMVNAERAVEQDVFANNTPLNIGYFQYPHDNKDPVTKTISYSNTSSQDVTLDLSSDVSDPDGDDVPDGMVTLSKDEVSIPSGDTVDVDVTVDPALGTYGFYSGYINAESIDGETIVNVPIGFYKETESYDLTIKGTDRDGEPTTESPSMVDVINVEDKQIFEMPSVYTWNKDGVITVRVPVGTYSVMGWMYMDKDESLSMVGNPEINVEEDTTIHLDARKANKIDVNLEKEVKRKLTNMTYYRKMEDNGKFLYSFIGNEQLYAAPTEPVNKGEFEFYTQFEFTSPEDFSGTPYTYELVLPNENNIPSDLQYDIEDESLAEEKNSYFASGPYEVHQYKWRPYEDFAFSGYDNFNVAQERIEYFSPNDTTYRKMVAPQQAYSQMIYGPVTKYEKGKQDDVTWFKAPLKPGVIRGKPPVTPSLPVSRQNDELSVELGTPMDANNNWGIASEGVNLKMYQDDELVAETDDYMGTFPLSSKKANYRLEMTTQQDVLPISTNTKTSWTFESENEGGDDEQQIVPMLTLDYDLDLQLNNTASLPKEVNGTIPVTFTVDHQPEAKDIPIDKANLWISYNDGEDWQEINDLQSSSDGVFTADIPDLKDNRNGSGYISLKVEAYDTEGNSIEQEITRAYRLNFEGDINEDHVIDIYDVLRAVAFYGKENKDVDINGDGVVDEKDMRILEKNFLKVGPKASKNVQPKEKLGNKGLDDLLRSVGLEPEN